MYRIASKQGSEGYAELNHWKVLKTHGDSAQGIEAEIPEAVCRASALQTAEELERIARSCRKAAGCAQIHRFNPVVMLL
jgi:hypothetical protein